ncbi:MAG: hypothetical protein H0U92_05380 [Actinobacteria bacterium]|nr:hypothetical protein [Actinomycetota bacterium]
MRRFLALVAGALAFVAMTGLGWTASAQDSTTTTTTTNVPTKPTTQRPTTTTTTTGVPTTSSPTTTPPTRAPGNKATTTTTATTAGTGNPVPPPASGASQPLDPGLLGGTIVPIAPPSTLFGTETTLSPTSTVPVTSALNVNSANDGPSGPTLGLAAVAWLASLGGLLVYAEDQRGKRWRHLAR